MENLTIVGWTDFDDVYPTIECDQESLPRVIELIVNDICENKYCFSGNNHQNSTTGVPVFSNGTCFRASMRAWGQIMADAQSRLTGKEYSYMDFYMSCGADVKMPVLKDSVVEPAEVENSIPGYMVNADAQMLAESQALGMSFLTTDKVLRAFTE